MVESEDEKGDPVLDKDGEPVLVKAYDKLGSKYIYP